MLSARLRAGPSANVVVMIERLAGAVNAAAAPLRKRVAIEQGAVVDHPAEDRREREDRQRADQHAPAPEQVGEAPAEQQQAAVAEHVAGHDPLQRGGGEVEVGADRGERDADHRDVEPVEEEDTAEHHERAPEARVPVQVRVGGRGRGGENRHGRMRLHACASFAGASFVKRNICWCLAKVHARHDRARAGSEPRRELARPARSARARHLRARARSPGRARAGGERVRGAGAARRAGQGPAPHAGAGRLRPPQPERAVAPDRAARSRRAS